MNKHHWQIVALLVGGLAVQLTGIHAWSEATSPQFIAGFLMQAAAAAKGLFTEKPEIQ